MPKQKPIPPSKNNLRVSSKQVDSCGQLLALNQQLQAQLAEQDRLLEQAQQRVAALEEDKKLNTHLFEQTQRSLQEIVTLYRMVSSLNLISDLRQMAEFALTEYLQALNLSQGGVLIFDDDKATGTLMALVANGQVVEPGLRISVTGNLACERMLQAKTPLLIDEAVRDSMLEPRGSLVHKPGYKSMLLVPIMVRDEVIGALEVDALEAIHTYTQAEITLGQAMANQLGIALENQRLLAKTQAALAQAERLYETSRRLNEAKNLQEIVALVAETGAIPAINRVLIFLAERNSQGEIEAMAAAANWYSGQGTPPSPVGRRYLLTTPGVDTMLTREPLLIQDAWQDERLAGPIQAVLTQQHICSMAYLPLWVGERQLGTILLEGEEPHLFTPQEIQPYLSLAPQVAVALQNRLLLEEAQARARREQLLREVTTRVRSAVDAETIMRTAVQEVGRVLGRPTFIYLGQEQPGPAAPAPELEGKVL
jgi:GAF domain-containing protein